ncbi:MAG: CBS domain-containing protein [Pseudomonadota bacterium]
MKVKDILKKKGGRVETVRPGESVSVLCKRLRTGHIGALVVSQDSEHMEGIVSERDVVACIAEHGTRAMTMTVSEIMTTRVTTCREDDNLSAIARKMTEQRFRHVPVMKDGRLTGVVSIGDIVQNRLEEVELEAGVLRDIALVSH